MKNEEELKRLPYVMEKTSLAKSTIYLYMKLNRFPRAYKIGRSSLWKKTEILEWIDNVTTKVS